MASPPLRATYSTQHILFPLSQGTSSVQRYHGNYMFTFEHFRRKYYIIPSVTFQQYFDEKSARTKLSLQPTSNIMHGQILGKDASLLVRWVAIWGLVG